MDPEDLRHQQHPRELPLHIDDSIGAMVFSMIGQPSVEDQLRYHLSLSQNSCRFLQTQLRDLQTQHQLLGCRMDAAKTEASLNASALKKKIEDYIALSSAYEKLLKECELFRTDREVFAEAAEDAEERRDEAEKRAVQAEVWAAEAELRAAKAEQKERAATNFIVTLLKSSSKDKLQILASSEVKARWGVATALENTKTGSLIHKNREKKERPAVEVDQFCSYPDSPKKLNLAVIRKQAGSIDAVQSPVSIHHKDYRAIDAVQSPVSIHRKDYRGTKRIHFDASKPQGEFRNVVRQRTGKNALDRSKLRTATSKVTRLQTLSSEEKENFGDLDAEARAKIEEASHSDNETMRYLVDLLVILKKNLVKAEAEGDLIYRKYCEIQKLLMDSLATFGILPEVSEGKTSLSPSGVILEELVNRVEGT